MSYVVKIRDQNLSPIEVLGPIKFEMPTMMIPSWDISDVEDRVGVTFSVSGPLILEVSAHAAHDLLKRATYKSKTESPTYVRIGFLVSDILEANNSNVVSEFYAYDIFTFTISSFVKVEYFQSQNEIRARLVAEPRIVDRITPSKSNLIHISEL